MALRRPDLIAQDLAPILIYANQIRPQLSAERLEEMVHRALPLPTGAVMDKTFERLIEQGHQAGLQEGVLQGTERGLLTGLQEAVALGVELKFGAEGLGLLPQVRRIHDVAVLRMLRQELPRLHTLAQLQRLLAKGG